VEEIAHGALHMRHAGRTTHHHHAIHIVRIDIGVAQRFLDGVHGLGNQVLGDLVERLRRDPQMHFLARTEHRVHRHFIFGRQQFLGFARLHHQHGRVFVRQRRQLFFLMDVAEQAVVKSSPPAPNRRPWTALRTRPCSA
jgi:hypothetical protein